MSEKRIPRQEDLPEGAVVEDGQVNFPSGRKRNVAAERRLRFVVERAVESVCKKLRSAGVFLAVQHKGVAYLHTTPNSDEFIQHLLSRLDSIRDHAKKQGLGDAMAKVPVTHIVAGEAAHFLDNAFPPAIQARIGVVMLIQDHDAPSTSTLVTNMGKEGVEGAIKHFVKENKWVTDPPAPGEYKAATTEGEPVKKGLVEGNIFLKVVGWFSAGITFKRKSETG